MASQLAARRLATAIQGCSPSTTLSLVLDWNRPVKLFIETKHPVRYGALVESKVLALLHRYGIASPASADLSRAVVMSFLGRRGVADPARRPDAANSAARRDLAISG